MGATGYIMEPFDAYKYYMAIKLHFESDSYDAPKYNFKTSISPQSFWKRRDKYHFAKLSRKFNKPGPEPEDAWKHLEICSMKL